VGVYKPSWSRFWWGSYQLQGQRKFESLGVVWLGKASDRRLAEDALRDKRREFEAEIDAGVVVNKRLSLAVMVEEYMRLHSVPNKRSAKNDETIFKRLKAYFGADLPIMKITPNSLELYRTARLAEKISPARVNREMATLKNMFSKAVLWGRVRENPVKRISMYREENKRERFLVAEEKAALLNKSPDWMRPIIVTALNTGMRQGEILSLKWADVNLAQAVLLVATPKVASRAILS
jgi:integrase